MSLTHDRLREVLRYNKRTGVFTWKVAAAHRRKAGDVAGNGSGYQGRRRIRIDGTLYYAYRLAWFYVMGSWPENKIDHRNGDPTDDRWTNLRDVTHGVNMQNQRRATRRNATGLLGAHVTREGRFTSSITTDHKKKRLGSFDSAEAAHEAYLKEKRRSHPGCTI